MSIPVTDWECPPPKAGERPVVISEAARITGHSRSAIRVRVDDGRLPCRVPVGQTRPRKVFPSQVLAAFGEEEAS